MSHPGVRAVTGHTHRVHCYGPDDTAPSLDEMGCTPEPTHPPRKGPYTANAWTECCTSYQCTAGEWVLAKARKGDRIRWRRPLPNGGFGPWTTGSFSWSMFYDGLMGKAYEDDPDDLVEVSLRPDCCDEVELVHALDRSGAA